MATKHVDAVQYELRGFICSALCSLECNRGSLWVQSLELELSFFL